MNEGLVAPSWSDSGEVPVGEVTYTYDDPISSHPEWCRDIPGVMPNTIVWAPEKPADAQRCVVRIWQDGKIVGQKWGVMPPDVLEFDTKPSDPNAKPSLPSLSRVSGEDYRGLGWCDE